MRAPARDSGAGLDINMTPLVDIVFLLIVFFVVSSHLAKQEIQLQLDLPDALSARRVSATQARRLVVNVLPGGKLMLAGSVVTADELEKMVAYESRRAKEVLEVRIRSDRNVPYEQIEPVLVSCARGGVWNVSFAVVESDGSAG